MSDNIKNPSVTRVTENKIKTIDDLKLVEKQEFQEAFTEGTPQAWIACDDAVTEAYESVKDKAEKENLSLVNLMGVTALVNVIVARKIMK